MVVFPASTVQQVTRVKTTSITVNTTSITVAPTSSKNATINDEDKESSNIIPIAAGIGAAVIVVFIIIIITVVLLVIWHHKKTGKFIVGNKKSEKVEVQNDLYGFTGEHNHSIDANDRYDHNCYEQYDPSNRHQLKTSNSSYKKSNSQDDTSTLNKQNTVLSENPLYGDKDMYDSTYETNEVYTNLDNPYAHDEKNDAIPTNNLPSHIYSHPPNTSEIYMNISHDNCGAQMGTDEEYNYCRH